MEGYKAALAKYNIKFDESYIQHCNHGGMIIEEVEHAIKNLYSLKNKPDAIFTAGDRLTTVCFGVLKRMKPRKEAGFTGFTNTILADLLDPPLTVIQQPAFEIGQFATEKLIQLIESKRPVTSFETKVLDTTLIVRESSLKHQ